MENKEKQFTKQDMINFANYVYKYIADMPGHEPDEIQLNEWLTSNNNLSG